MRVKDIKESIECLTKIEEESGIEIEIKGQESQEWKNKNIEYINDLTVSDIGKGLELFYKIRTRNYVTKAKIIIVVNSKFFITVETPIFTPPKQFKCKIERIIKEAKRIREELE